MPAQSPLRTRPNPVHTPLRTLPKPCPKPAQNPPNPAPGRHAFAAAVRLAVSGVTSPLSAIATAASLALQHASLALLALAFASLHQDPGAALAPGYTLFNYLIN